LPRGLFEQGHSAHEYLGACFKTVKINAGGKTCGVY
jgi:hypothetical protein